MAYLSALCESIGVLTWSVPASCRKWSGSPDHSRPTCPNRFIPSRTPCTGTAPRRDPNFLLLVYMYYTRNRYRETPEVVVALQRGHGPRCSSPQIKISIGFSDPTPGVVPHASTLLDVFEIVAFQKADLLLRGRVHEGNVSIGQFGILRGATGSPGGLGPANPPTLRPASISTHPQGQILRANLLVAAIQRLGVFL